MVPQKLAVSPDFSSVAVLFRYSEDSDYEYVFHFSPHLSDVKEAISHSVRLLIDKVNRTNVTHAHIMDSHLRLDVMNTSVISRVKPDLLDVASFCKRTTALLKYVL